MDEDMEVGYGRGAWDLIKAFSSHPPMPFARQVYPAKGNKIVVGLPVEEENLEKALI